MRLTAGSGESIPSSASAPPRCPARSASASAILTCHALALEPVALPMAIGDIGRVLVPVPGAGIAIEVVRRVGRVDRVADPADRQRLVHERAVGAVEREAGAPVAPILSRIGEAPAVLAVAAHPPEPLTGATGIHRECELLLVLGDLEGSGRRADAAAGV